MTQSTTTKKLSLFTSKWKLSDTLAVAGVTIGYLTLLGDEPLRRLAGLITVASTLGLSVKCFRSSGVRQGLYISGATAGVLALVLIYIGVSVSFQTQQVPQTLDALSTTSSSTTSANTKTPSFTSTGSPTSDTASSQSSSTTPPPSISLPALAVSATCELSGFGKQEVASPGSKVAVSYTLVANTADNVGVGAGVYGSDRSRDYSNGDGDVDDLRIASGTNSLTRLVSIPSDIGPGDYEIDVEIWPANKIGADGADTYADAVCGSVSVH